MRTLRSAHALVVTLLTFSAVPARAASPVPAPVPTPRPVAPAMKPASQRMEKEGPPERRAEYFAMRRRAPGRPDFNAARARLLAVAERDRQIVKMGRSALVLGTTWSPIGPSPITGGQTPGNGAARSAVTGRFTAIAFSGGTAFVAAAQGGLWKSVDSGATWTEVTGPPFQTLAIGSIAVDPQNASTIYVGTGEDNANVDGYFGVGVYKSVDGGTTWTGPYNLTPGAIGTDVFTGRGIGSFVVDRTDSNAVFACTGSGIGGQQPSVPNPGSLPNRGVYKSTDAGVHWTNVSTPSGGGAGDFRCSNLIQDPVHPTNFFAAMNQKDLPAGSSTFNGGLLLSTDSGATWTQLAGLNSPPYPFPSPTPNYTLPANSGVTNQEWGRAWVAASAASGATESTIYVGTAMANQADASLNPPPPIGWPSNTPPKVVPTPKAGIGPGRIYRSTDSGKNWDLLDKAYGYCGGQCFYDLPVYAVPLHPNLVFAGGAGGDATNLASNPPVVAMFRGSNDSGATWQDMVNGSGTALHADQHFIQAEPGSQTNIWVANDGGIWRTTGGVGGSWSNLNTLNLSATQFQTIDLHPTNPSIVYGGTQDNGTNSWSGSGAWIHSDDGDGGFALINQANPNNVVHTYFNVSNDPNAVQIGASFATAGPGSTPAQYSPVIGFCSACAAGSVDQNNGIAKTDRVLFYAPMAFDKGTGAAASTLYFGTTKLYKASSFFGNAALAVANPVQPVFTDISAGNDLAGPTGALSAIEPVANGAAEAQVIFTGSSLGSVWRTTDGGGTWTDTGGGGSNMYISDIAVDPTTTASVGSMVVYIAESGFESVPGKNVKKSMDGGASWADSGSGLPNVPVNALLVDPVVHTRIWAGTDIGVYLSLDSGATWNPYTTGMPTVAVFDMKASSSGDQIFAATHGRGVYRLSPLTPVILSSFDAD